MLFGLDWKELLLLVPVLLVTMTVHECAHGFAAYKLGDNTAKIMGRLSLNPFKHIDIVGFVMLMTVGFGWAKPVPINVNNFKSPKKGMAISSLAGPAANVLLAFISAVLFVFIQPSNYYVVKVLVLLLQFNAMFAMFNLLPIPPLDGSKIVFALLPERVYFTVMQFERIGSLILIVLLYTDVLTPTLSTGVTNLMNLLVRGADMLAKLVGIY